MRRASMILLAAMLQATDTYYTEKENLTSLTLTPEFATLTWEEFCDTIHCGTQLDQLACLHLSMSILQSQTPVKPVRCTSFTQNTLEGCSNTVVEDLFLAIQNIMAGNKTTYSTCVLKYFR